MTNPIAEAKGTPNTFEYGGHEWKVEKKPSLLLIAEITQAEKNDDPEGLALLAEFFQRSLGSQYAAFREVTLDQDVEPGELMEVLQKIWDASNSRPLGSAQD